ncbi:MAG: sodium:solute symporter family protein [Candidatus Marinimicrobia bacterium]|nr:sodium:solute symporter family protein [Candidatus Neomarinimicrobiota bacterium]
METKYIWLTAFVGIYWAYCLFWGFKGARAAKTSTDYFLAGRSIGVWVFVLAATATSFSGWTFVGHPGKIFTDGLPYAFASFYALTIPFTGVLFLRRQWVLGRAYNYITPGEMYSDYYGGNAMRLLTVLVAFLFSVPYLGVQLKASGSLFNVLSDGFISVNLGMFALTAIVVIYVASGGLKSVAYVDCAQAVLLAVGIAILGGVALHYSGGWSGFTSGLSNLVMKDVSSGQNLTPDGYSMKVAIPGSIQMVSAGAKAAGGAWTGIMCMTYMFALMGIQSSPAFSMWAFANKTPQAFRWQQVVASSLIVGIILFTFTIFQGLGAHILVENGILKNITDTNLIPELINLLSATAPWLVGLLAVCALAAMQSTGSGYMSTFSAMVTRDIYAKYISPDASDSNQKNIGRLFVVMVAGAALIVAANSSQAIVMLGGLAVAYGFQMYPALIGICYYKGFTTKGVVYGLIVGLIAVTLTDKTSAWFGVPWGAYPLTIHSAGWGIFFNLLTTFSVSKFFVESNAEKEMKEKKHQLLQAVTGLNTERKKKVKLAWALTLFWFLVGFGPFATIGNDLFSNPNSPSLWTPFGLPSLWVWQLVFLGYGIFVMWFLAFHMGMSEPIDPKKVKRQIT